MVANATDLFADNPLEGRAGPAAGTYQRDIPPQNAPAGAPAAPRADADPPPSAPPDTATYNPDDPPPDAAVDPHAQRPTGENMMRGFTRGMLRSYLTGVSGLSEKGAEAEIQQWGLQAPQPTIVRDPAHPVTAELETGASRLPEFLGGLAVPTPTGIAGATGQLLSGARYADLADRTTAGMRSGSAALQATERVLARLPGGGALVKSIRELNQRYADTTTDIANRMAEGKPVSPTLAGKRIEEQIGTREKALKAESEDLYQEVDRQIPPETPIAPDRYVDKLRELTTPNPLAPGQTRRMINPMLADLRQGLEEDLKQPGVTRGYLPYGAMKDIRSRIGRQLDTGVFATDKPNAELKQLYGAITADMMNGASAVSPQASAAVRRANTRYQEISREREALDQVLKDNGGSENVFRSLMSSAEQKGRWGGGATQLERVLAALDEPSRRYLAASVLSQLGRARPGAQELAAGTSWSADTFFTNWQALSPEARTALFGRLPGDYANQMTQLVANVESLKAYAKLLPNVSNTAQILLFGEAMTTALGSVMRMDLKEVALLGGQIAVTKALSTALTNPETVKWLAARTGKLVMTASAQLAKGSAGLEQPRSLRGYDYQMLDPDAAATARDPFQLSDFER